MGLIGQDRAAKRGAANGLSERYEVWARSGFLRSFPTSAEQRAMTFARKVSVLRRGHVRVLWVRDSPSRDPITVGAYASGVEVV